MPQTSRIVAKLRPEGPRETWGLYLPDEERWLDLLFVRELDARRFAKDLMDGTTAA